MKLYYFKTRQMFIPPPYTINIKFIINRLDFLIKKKKRIGIKNKKINHTQKLAKYPLAN